MNKCIKKRTLLTGVLFLLLFVVSSCTEDNTTLDIAYTDCPACHGRGWFEEKSMLGLKTTYYDCFMCKTRYEKECNSYNPSFKGYSTSCNIPSHNCKGFVPSKHDSNICASCLENGHKCHKVNHQGAK